MKRILLNSALAVALASTAAFAQQSTQQPTQPSGDATTQQPTVKYGHHGRHGKMDPHKAAQHLGKRLGLSDDQMAKLEPIFADQQQKMAALHSNTSLTEDQRREQARAIFKDTHTQLSSVLTPDQMQQLNSMRHNFRGGKRQQPQQQPEATTPPSAS
jgi:Spy/CpxP family protein refolding chaperone